MPPTLRLRVLGGLTLDGLPGGAAGAGTQRRPLTLLAALAASGERGLSRERLAALFWPDSDEERARNVLRQTLHALRRDLREPEIVLGTTDLRLNAQVVGVDVVEFDAAIARGAFEEAVAVYGGPLLDGVHVPNAPELERWIEDERARRLTHFRQAARALAERATAAGEHAAAVAHWRRLATADPLDPHVAIGLMRALAHLGDVPGALRQARVYETLLRQELDVPVPGEVAATVDWLRDGAPGAVGPTASPDTAPADPPAVDPPAVGSAAAPAPAPAPEPSTVAAAPVTPAAVRPRIRRAWAGAVLALALAATGAAWATRRASVRGLERPHFEPNRVAVLYFDALSARDSTIHLADGLTERLIHELSAVRALRVVPSHGVKPFQARATPLDSIVDALQVGTVVEGSVRRTGKLLEVTVRVLDANSGRYIGSETIERPASELPTLEAKVAQQVAAFLRRQLGQQITLSSVRASDVDAHARDLFLRAERARKDAAEQAADAHPEDVRTALTTLQLADTLLAEAERADRRWLEPIVTRGWVELTRARLQRGAPRQASIDRALAHATRAARRAPTAASVLELRGTAAWRRIALGDGPPPESTNIAVAERDLRAAVGADSSNASAMATLSQLLRNAGKLREADLWARRALEADAYLVNAGDVLSQLYRSAMMLGNAADAAAWCNRGRLTEPRDWRFVECELTLMRLDLALADPRRAWELVALLDRMDPPDVASAAGRGYSVVYRRMVAAAVAARAGQRDSAQAVLAWALREVAGDAERRVDLYYDEALLLLALGRRPEAMERLRAYKAARPPYATFVDRDPAFRAFGVTAVK